MEKQYREHGNKTTLPKYVQTQVRGTELDMDLLEDYATQIAVGDVHLLSKAASRVYDHYQRWCRYPVGVYNADQQHSVRDCEPIFTRLEHARELAIVMAWMVQFLLKQEEDRHDPVRPTLGMM